MLLPDCSLRNGLYIQNELNFQVMINPIKAEPFKLHISPFMTRAKLDSDCRKTIMDLSYSKGLSVNDGLSNDTYLGIGFQLHYPPLSDF